MLLFVFCGVLLTGHDTLSNEAVEDLLFEVNANRFQQAGGFYG